MRVLLSEGEFEIRLLRRAATGGGGSGGGGPEGGGGGSSSSSSSSHGGSGSGGGQGNPGQRVSLSSPPDAALGGSAGGGGVEEGPCEPPGDEPAAGPGEVVAARAFDGRGTELFIVAPEEAEPRGGGSLEAEALSALVCSPVGARSGGARPATRGTVASRAALLGAALTRGQWGSRGAGAGGFPRPATALLEFRRGADGSAQCRRVDHGSITGVNTAVLLARSSYRDKYSKGKLYFGQYSRKFGAAAEVFREALGEEGARGVEVRVVAESASAHEAAPNCRVALYAVGDLVYEACAAGKGVGVFLATPSRLGRSAGKWVDALRLALPEVESSVGFGTCRLFTAVTATFHGVLFPYAGNTEEWQDPKQLPEVLAATSRCHSFYADLSHATAFAHRSELGFDNRAVGRLAEALVGNAAGNSAVVCVAHSSPLYSHGVSGAGSAESQVLLPQVVFRGILKGGPWSVLVDNPVASSPSASVVQEAIAELGRRGGGFFLVQAAYKLTTDPAEFEALMKVASRSKVAVIAMFCEPEVLCEVAAAGGGGSLALVQAAVAGVEVALGAEVAAPSAALAAAAEALEEPLARLFSWGATAVVPMCLNGVIVAKATRRALEGHSSFGYSFSESRLIACASVGTELPPEAQLSRRVPIGANPKAMARVTAHVQGMLPQCLVKSELLPRRQVVCPCNGNEPQRLEEVSKVQPFPALCSGEGGGGAATQT